MHNFVSLKLEMSFRLEQIEAFLLIQSQYNLGQKILSIISNIDTSDSKAIALVRANELLRQKC